MLCEARSFLGQPRANGHPGCRACVQFAHLSSSAWRSQRLSIALSAASQTQPAEGREIGETLERHILGRRAGLPAVHIWSPLAHNLSRYSLTASHASDNPSGDPTKRADDWTRAELPELAWLQVGLMWAFRYAVHARFGTHVAGCSITCCLQFSPLKSSSECEIGVVGPSAKKWVCDEV